MDGEIQFPCKGPSHVLVSGRRYRCTPLAGLSVRIINYPTPRQDAHHANAAPLITSNGEIDPFSLVIISVCLPALLLPLLPDRLDPNQGCASRATATTRVALQPGVVDRPSGAAEAQRRHAVVLTCRRARDGPTGLEHASDNRSVKAGYWVRGILGKVKRLCPTRHGQSCDRDVVLDRYGLSG